MNATIYQYHDAPESMLKVDFRPGRPSFGDRSKSRPHFGRSRGKGPQQYNGIHRRRRKKITW